MITTWKNYEFTSHKHGNKTAPWDSRNTNSYLVYIYNTKTGKRIQFDFWMSLAKPKMTSRGDLLNAVECFLSDAQAGTMDYSEFCHEFGYDEWGEYGRNAKSDRTWKACKRALEKFEAVFDEDIYDVCNEFREYMESKEEEYETV